VSVDTKSRHFHRISSFFFNIFIFLILWPEIEQQRGIERSLQDSWQYGMHWNSMFSLDSRIYRCFVLVDLVKFNIYQYIDMLELHVLLPRKEFLYVKWIFKKKFVKMKWLFVDCLFKFSYFMDLVVISSTDFIYYAWILFNNCRFYCNWLFIASLLWNILTFYDKLLETLHLAASKT